MFTLVTYIFTAHQIYGDPEMHDQIRQLCMDYMELNRDHFSQYVTEEWSDYIRRKRQDRCFGNHTEMQAISELFNRPIEVYAHCTGVRTLLPRTHKALSITARTHLLDSMESHRAVEYLSWTIQCHRQSTHPIELPPWQSLQLCDPSRHASCRCRIGSTFIGTWLG